MKKLLLAIPVIIIIVIIIYLQFKNNSGMYNVSQIDTRDSIATDRIQTKLDNTIDSFNLLKPIVQETIDKIKYYEGVRNDFEKQVSAHINEPNNEEVDNLRRKLADANAEIGRLNKELAGLESKKEYTTYVRPKIKKDSLIEAPVITPDESSVVIELDGGGVVTPDNLLIYLIPYTKKVKKYMVYEASCSLGLSENRVAQYYNGVYFFNAVDNGKYLIKICTPYGNYKRITKESEKQTIKMKIAPPLQ